MNRPYVFCHMMTSLDGKIMGNYMDTPEGSAAGDVFYNLSFGKNPFYKHQGWLSGRWCRPELVLHSGRDVR